MPGHYAYVNQNGRLDIYQYWDFDFSGDLQISEEEAIQETDRLLNKLFSANL